jgi:hypothetical protein
MKGTTMKKKLFTFSALGLLLVACTQQQAQTVTNAVFTDLQAGCMAAQIATEVIPDSSSVTVQKVANDIAAACNITTQFMPQLQNFVTTFIQQFGAKKAMKG